MDFVPRASIDPATRGTGTIGPPARISDKNAISKAVSRKGRGSRVIWMRFLDFFEGG